MNLREKNEAGATAVEYGLMVVFIASAIFATVFALGLTVDGIYPPLLEFFN